MYKSDITITWDSIKTFLKTLFTFWVLLLERILRRRALRSNASQSDQQTSPTSQSGSENTTPNDASDQPNTSNLSNNEESQSSTVSSTSSPLDNSVSRLSVKRVSYSIAHGSLDFFNPEMKHVWSKLCLAVHFDQ